MTTKVDFSSAWQKLQGGPCLVLRRLICHKNASEFDPFSWLTVCYCSPDFDRADVVAPHPRPNRETLNYLVTGLVDAPELEDEQAARDGVTRWVDTVGGLVQKEPSQSVYVVDMELWMRVEPDSLPGGAKRWELESEHIPLVHAGGADVRVLCGLYDGVEGAIIQQPLGTSVFDITLSPGGSFAYSVPKENTTVAYVFGGSAMFGRLGETLYSKDSLLRLSGGEIFTAATENGCRFLLFSARPLGGKNPLPCPEEQDKVCLI